jgi:hypothetical protein
MSHVKAKAYLRVGCPYSFKFLLFMAEAGLLDQIDVIRCDPRGPNFESIKAKLAVGLGKPATFPTVEIEPGRYRSDSDQLIEYYAKKNNVAVSELPALAFYKDSIFPQVVELHEMHENKGRADLPAQPDVRRIQMPKDDRRKSRPAGQGASKPPSLSIGGKSEDPEQ